jgi:hypothetical protein
VAKISSGVDQFRIFLGRLLRGIRTRDLNGVADPERIKRTLEDENEPVIRRHGQMA